MLRLKLDLWTKFEFGAGRLRECSPFLMISVSPHSPKRSIGHTIPHLPQCISFPLIILCLETLDIDLELKQGFDPSVSGGVPLRRRLSHVSEEEKPMPVVTLNDGPMIHLESVKTVLRKKGLRASFKRPISVSSIFPKRRAIGERRSRTGGRPSPHDPKPP